MCQLRLDFQTFSGFAVDSTTSGLCDDSLAAAGQTGKDPPSICGTNTDYHSETWVVQLQTKVIRRCPKISHREGPYFQGGF